MYRITILSLEREGTFPMYNKFNTHSQNGGVLLPLWRPELCSPNWANNLDYQRVCEDQHKDICILSDHTRKGNIPIADITLTVHIFFCVYITYHVISDAIHKHKHKYKHKHEHIPTEENHAWVPDVSDSKLTIYLQAWTAL